MWESYMFELELSSEVQKQINLLEKQLWEELYREKIHDECRKSVNWILDLGHNVGRLILYE